MLIVSKQRYKRKHVIGGAGLFDTVVNFSKRLATSNAAKAVASRLSSAAQTELGKKAIEAGKTAAKQIGLHAIDVGKDIAIAKAKTLIDRAAPLAHISKNQEVIKQPSVLTQKSKDTLASLITSANVASNMEPTTNLNKLLAGSGVHNAVAIQDLIKRLNTGAGLRLA